MDELSSRDLMILGAFTPGETMTYRRLVNACLPQFHPTPHELVVLRKAGLLDRTCHGRYRHWFITDAGIERVEVAGV